MKVRTTPFVKSLLVGLLLATALPTAGATDTKPDETPTDEQSFAIGMFMGAQKKVHLLLDLRQSRWVEVILKDRKNAILHRVFVKKNARPSRIKYDFRESDPGLYRLEISDGKQTQIRQVEVVDFPEAVPHRYIAVAP